MAPARRRARAHTHSWETRSRSLLVDTRITPTHLVVGRLGLALIDRDDGLPPGGLPRAFEANEIQAGGPTTNRGRKVQVQGVHAGEAGDAEGFFFFFPREGGWVVKRRGRSRRLRRARPLTSPNATHTIKTNRQLRSPCRVLDAHAGHARHQVPLLGRFGDGRLAKVEAVPVDKRAQAGGRRVCAVAFAIA